jgi:hypothetical protein
MSLDRGVRESEEPSRPPMGPTEPFAKVQQLTGTDEISSVRWCIKVCATTDHWLFRWLPDPEGPW